MITLPVAQGAFYQLSASISATHRRLLVANPRSGKFSALARLLDEIDNLLLAVDTELRIDISHMHFHRITRNHKFLFHEGEIAALS